MESKLAENSKKIQALDEVVKSIKVVEAKQADKELGEKKSASLPKDLSELDKIKADIISLKNNDIEKLKVNYQELIDTVKAIQATIKSREK